MSDDDSQLLKEAVEKLHSRQAKLKQVHFVTELFRGEIVWSGEVHEFNVLGHPETDICYAFCLFMNDFDKRRCYAILHIPPIKSPSDAVRISILGQLKDQGYGDP